MELVSELPGGQAAKNNADKIIDLNGTKKTGGTGIKQLRENIAESKLSYEIMDDAAQAFLKTKIMDNIQKYFYLICFTGYLREQSKVAKDGVTEEQKKNVRPHWWQGINTYGKFKSYQNIPNMDG